MYWALFKGVDKERGLTVCAKSRLGYSLVFLVFVLAMFAMPVSVQAAPPVPGAPTKVVLAPYGLRLREDPSLAAPVILTLYNGEFVYPLAGPVWNQGISWTFVRVYRWGRYYDGYCASAYLRNYEGYVPTGEHGLMVTAPAGLRLRSGPGPWYATRRIVPYGTILQPTGASQWGGGILWRQVSINGTWLWAASDYLRPV